MIMFISEWFQNHKTLILTMIILAIGGFGGFFALTKEEVMADEQVIEEEIETSPPIEETEEPEIKEEEEKTIVIDIKGAVKNPNVYEVKEETRIQEVINLAGGLTEDATTININLSKKVTDEMVIYIFTKKEYAEKIVCQIENEYDGEITKEIQDHQSIIDKNTEKSDKVSLNNASLEELMTIDGIGESKAKNIIEYRTNNNGFKSIEELKKVTGIGESLYEKIKIYFTL